MGTRLEAVLRAGEAHRRLSSAPVHTGALEMEDFDDDVLRLILDRVVSGNPKEACEAAANWCALNKRHRTLCKEGGDAMWATLTTRIFGPNIYDTPTPFWVTNERKNFYAMCERAAAYRQAKRRIKDHPGDEKVRVFLAAAQQGMNDALSTAVIELEGTRSESWYSATQIDKVLFNPNKAVDGIEEGAKRRSDLSNLLQRFASLFENMVVSKTRLLYGPGTRRSLMLAAKFFAHAVLFQVSVQDFKRTHMVDEEEEKLEYLHDLEEEFHEALVRGLQAVQFPTPFRRHIDAEAIMRFYRDWVMEDMFWLLVTRINPSDNRITTELLDEAVHAIMIA